MICPGKPLNGISMCAVTAAFHTADLEWESNGSFPGYANWNMSAKQFSSHACSTGFIPDTKRESDFVTMKRVGVISLACPKYLGDTEAMLGQLVDKGYSIAPDPSDSDIVIINT